MKRVAWCTGKFQESIRKGSLSWIYRLVHRTLMVALEDYCSTVEMWREQEEVVDEEGLTGKGKATPPGCSLKTVVEAEEVAVEGTVAVEEVAGKVVDGVTGFEEVEEVGKEDCSLVAAGTDHHQEGRNKTPVGEGTGLEAEAVVMKVPGDCAAG